MHNSIKSYWQNYIDGSFVDGGGGTIDVEDPGTGQVLAQQAAADAADVDKAVAAARAVVMAGDWAGLRPVERGRAVRAMGEYLMSNQEEVARVLTLEAGKPLWEARLEIEGAARYFEYYGNQAETLEGRSVPLGSGYFDFTVCEPYGISAQIIPWNYPLEMAARSASAALASGNACVVKTPELDPLSCSYIAMAAAESGIPDGALNMLCGHGDEAGASLAGHPDIDQIVFTGSVSTGVSVLSAAAKNVVPCVVELGGKSAAMLFDDADLDAFMSDVRWGIFFNAGQVCSAMARIIAHESIYDDVVEKTAELARSISVGRGIERAEFGNNMGAMISRSQRDRAVEMVQQARQAGANVVTGGVALPQAGYFMEPTVIADVASDAEIVQKEVFGPVITVQKFRTDKEALALANGTQYGLVAGIFTADINRATRAARGLHAGQIFINEWFAGGVETPFGGYGKSGFGREKGREALWNYVQTKNIAMRVPA